MVSLGYLTEALRAAGNAVLRGRVAPLGRDQDIAGQTPWDRCGLGARGRVPAAASGSFLCLGPPLGQRDEEQTDLRVAQALRSGQCYKVKLTMGWPAPKLG